MRGGRLVQSASPSEVYLSPSDPQVAEFVGRAVVLPGIATDAHATCALGEVVLTEPTDGPVVADDPSRAGLRRPRAPRGRPRGTDVEEVSYYGHDCAVQVRLDEGTSVLARMSGVLHPDRRRHGPPAGDRPRPGLPTGGDAVTRHLAPHPRSCERAVGRSSTTRASATRPRWSPTARS